MAHPLGQRLEGRVDFEAVEGREALEHLEVELVAPVPALDRARGQAQVRELDHPFRVEELDRPEPVALRTRARGVVEREQARLELAQRVAAARAGEAVGEQRLRGAVHVLDDHPAVRQAQRGLERFREPLPGHRTDLDAVDDDVDRMPLVLVQARQFAVQLDDAGAAGALRLGADSHPHEALGAQVLEQVQVLALAARTHRCQDHQARALRHGQRGVDHLRDALGFERLLRVVGAVGRAGPREKQPQVVVDFGDRAHRGARIVAGGLLLDGNRGRKALDEVDVRFLHQLEELPRIGRQRLHVAPLPLRVQRVERERGLARARKTGDHDQPVSRQVETDVLQVVRACAADADRVHLGRGRLPRRAAKGNRLIYRDAQSSALSPCR